MESRSRLCIPESQSLAQTSPGLDEKLPGASESTLWCPAASDVEVFRLQG